MKKDSGRVTTELVLIAIIFFLAFCITTPKEKKELYNEAYDAGMDEGYEIGYDEGFDNGRESSRDVDFESGYECGYDEGYLECKSSVPYACADYIDGAAKEKRYYHPEEAVCIIDEYIKADSATRKSMEEDLAQASDDLCEYYYYLSDMDNIEDHFDVYLSK